MLMNVSVLDGPRRRPSGEHYLLRDVFDDADGWL